MSVTLRLPTVLESAVGAVSVRIDGATVGEALDAACARLPNLRRHLLQDSGELRPHVLCLLNGVCLPRASFAGTAVRDGDVIEIHQAITGG